MKLERSDVEFAIWRKKVDKSLFEHNGTTMPEWACRMWKLHPIYGAVTSPREATSKATVTFNKKTYDAWVTTAPHGRSSPAFRLWYDPALSFELKSAFVMSYMRSLDTLVTTTPSSPDSLIFAPNGYIIYTEPQAGNLVSFDGTTNTLLASGLGTPGDLTLEPSGTSVLVSNVNGASILRVDLITKNVTTLFQKSGFTRFDGITYDNSGNLFVVANFNQVLQISPSTPNTIINQSPVILCNGGTTCLDGMTFDPPPSTGELWISYYYSGGIVSIPTSLSGFSGPFATNIPNPDGLESDGKGNIYVAAVLTNVWQYNIAQNTATKLNAVPGLDDLAPQAGSGSRPLGYVEICKAANTQFPPPNQLYDFTLTAPFFSVGPIQIPLGDCSGAIQVPAGAVCPDCLTITESPVLGVLVSDVTAIAYNSLGMQIPELIGWNSPDLNATVGVQAGDVSLETLVTFANYNVGQDGQLKICKIAGTPDVLNQPFTFTVTDPLGQQQYMIEAGPPDQGGYCVVADQFPVNTQVTIAETPNSSYPLSNIAVECDGCTYNVNLAQYNVTTTIGAGITEVDFTNSMPCNGNNLLSNGSFQTGDFTDWTTGGNFEDTEVVSGPFYVYPGDEDGDGFYAVLGPVGSDGTLSQTFATTPGQSYSVCFWLSAVGDNPSDFNAFWDGTQFLGLTNPNTGATSIVPVGVWKQFVYGPFTGTGSDTLTFSFRDDPEYIALDNVRVSDPHASPSDAPAKGPRNTTKP